MIARIPLSPFLLTIVVDFLSGLLLRAEFEGLNKDFKVGRNRIRVSCLCFVLFCFCFLFFFSRGLRL